MNIVVVEQDMVARSIEFDSCLNKEIEILQGGRILEQRLLLIQLCVNAEPNSIQTQFSCSTLELARSLLLYTMVVTWRLSSVYTCVVNNENILSEHVAQ